jgi:hypothetical protein
MFENLYAMKAKISSFLIVIVIVYFCTLPKALPVNPPPDGGYPGGNTAEGQNALLSITTGTYNTGIGLFSLESNATGKFNTAVGAATLLVNTADQNTATGAGALLSNTTGVNNTANGTFALFFNTTGGGNTAVGEKALFNNTSDSNTATGDSALFSNTTGDGNTANGIGALGSNTSGGINTAVGYFALQGNTTGIGNIGLGYFAGLNSITGSYNIHIGNEAFATDDHTIRIGSQGVQTGTFIAGIYGTTSSGTPVYIDSDGQLGISTSSARFKQNIQDMGSASDALMALRPVTFSYKPELDPRGIAQFGLVAEDVEKVNPALVVYDKERKPYTVRYDAVNAMLLNEFLKEHSKVQKLETTMAQQQKQIEALTAGLRKVSAQIEVSKPAPQIVLSDR